MQHKHTKHIYEDHLSKLPELTTPFKELHKILQNFKSERSINYHDLTLFETKLREKSSRGFGKYKCLEKGALKIY